MSDTDLFDDDSILASETSYDSSDDEAFDIEREQTEKMGHPFRKRLTSSTDQTKRKYLKVSDVLNQFTSVTDQSSTYPYGDKRLVTPIQSTADSSCKGSNGRNKRRNNDYKQSEKTPLQRPGNLLKDVRKTLHYPQKGKTSCAASASSLQNNLEDPGRSHDLTATEQIPNYSSNTSKEPHTYKDITFNKENMSNSEVVTAINGIGLILKTMFERVQNTEREVLKIKSRLSKDKPKEKKWQTVPLVVRSETRKMYQALIDEEENFTGFNIGPEFMFNDEENQTVVTKLIAEVQSLNTSFQASDIRSAAYTYYRTLNQQNSMKRRGLYDDRKQIRRCHERMIRKLHQRQSLFARSSLDEKAKEKWGKVLVSDMMSSEESDGETIFVKELPWRSATVNRFFQTLDEENLKTKSEQAKRQTKHRVMSGTSTRPKPSKNLPPWSIDHDLN